MSCPLGGTHPRWPWIVVNGVVHGVGWGAVMYAGYLDRGTKCFGGGGNGNSFIKVHFRPSADEPATLRGRHWLRLET